MVFKYYKQLTASQRRGYNKSDSVTSVKIPDAPELHPLVSALEESLAKENRHGIEMLSQKLISSLTVRLKAPAVKVSVLAARPHNSKGELYGLYNPVAGKLPAMITVWMRTARQKRVVAFKTFLRTLLHEICHHLDYEYFKFQYSFHTEGFYKRESSLFHQLVHSPEVGKRGKEQ